MKKLLTAFCIFLTIYAIAFPFTYFGSNTDKKEVRISHILVKTPEDAQKIKEELLNGKSFEDLEQKYTIDEQTKARKGDLGYIQRGRLHKNLEDVAFKLAHNKISEPVQTKDGWHIIKINDIKYYSEDESFKYTQYKYLDL